MPPPRCQGGPSTGPAADSEVCPGLRRSPVLVGRIADLRFSVPLRASLI